MLNKYKVKGHFGNIRLPFSLLKVIRFPISAVAVASVTGKSDPLRFCPQYGKLRWSSGGGEFKRGRYRLEEGFTQSVIYGGTPPGTESSGTPKRHFFYRLMPYLICGTFVLPETTIVIISCCIFTLAVVCSSVVVFFYR